MLYSLPPASSSSSPSAIRHPPSAIAMSEAGAAAEVSRIVDGLSRTEHKSIPFHLLYDHRGSQLYQKITELESYYPYKAEKALFQENALAIAAQVAPDSVIVELGCGVADKTALLLNAIHSKQGRCQYVGIDLSRTALDEVESSMRETAGLELELVHAEYLEGLEIVRNKYPDRSICVLWLGSSIGNLSQPECSDFVSRVIKIVGSRCQFFLCVDMWKDESMLRAAYDDDHGITQSFIKNGMRHGLELLGYTAPDSEIDSWSYEVDVNTCSRQVEMYVRFNRHLSLPEHNINIREDERVLVEISRKFTVDDVLQLGSHVGFVCHARWTSKAYGCFMTLACEEAILRCWADTDKLFKSVGEWTSQPISYRHPFFFYYGHIAAFFIIKLLHDESGSPLTQIFSRGMDPCMLDPSQCHKRPKEPPLWPSKETIKSYVQNGRVRVLEYLQRSTVDMRCVSLILEHERMHQETVTYMMAQQRKHDFEAPLVSTPHSLEDGVPASIKKPDVFIPRGSVVLGSDPVPGVFRFDNEEPAYRTEVEHDFWISSNPVTIGEFMLFIVDGGYDTREFWRESDFALLEKTGQKFPATWSYSRGHYYVHYPDKSLSWTDAREEPVYVSLIEAEAFCKWQGSRVMTEAEYHRVLDEESGRKERVKHLRNRGWEWTSSPLTPFKGFVSMKEYPEYSTDFFDNLHYVLKGSSPMTHISLLRDTFRNFYQLQYPYSFAKFRMCRLASSTATVNAL